MALLLLLTSVSHDLHTVLSTFLFRNVENFFLMLEKEKGDQNKKVKNVFTFMIVGRST